MFTGFITPFDVDPGACEDCIAAGILAADGVFGFSDDLHAAAPNNATVQQPANNACRARDHMDFLLPGKQQSIGFLQHHPIPGEKATAKCHEAVPLK
jgi:hypothetical protein